MERLLERSRSNLVTISKPNFSERYGLKVQQRFDIKKKKNLRQIISEIKNLAKEGGKINKKVIKIKLFLIIVLNY